MSGADVTARASIDIVAALRRERRYPPPQIGVTSRLQLGNAAFVQAGAIPAPLTPSHGPSIEPCRHRGDAMLEA